jgi:DNA-binding response OmpR family regulator
MQIGSLGPLEVRDGERLVVVPGQRLRRLLTQLALQPGRWISAGALADAVWGAEMPADPVNSLQSRSVPTTSTLWPVSPMRAGTSPG